MSGYKIQPRFSLGERVKYKALSIRPDDNDQDYKYEGIVEKIMAIIGLNNQQEYAYALKDVVAFIPEISLKKYDEDE